MSKKYFDTKKGSVEETITKVRVEKETIVKEEPKVSLQPKSYFGQKEGSLADVAAKVVSEDTHIHIHGDSKSEDNDLDVVNKQALKKKFDNRKDKDIDNDGDTDSADKYVHNKRQAITKALSKDEQAHIKKEFGIKYEALSPEKQKEMDKLMKDFLARGGKIQKLKPGIAKGAGHLDRRGAYKKDMLKGPKKHLAASKDNSDDLASKKKTATGQKVSSIDTKPNIKDV